MQKNGFRIKRVRGVCVFVCVWQLGRKREEKERARKSGKEKKAFATNREKR